MKNIEENVALIPLEKETNSFAKGNNFYKIFWVFMFGCFFGYIYEVALHFVRFGELVERKGVIYGPLNPVYGFAMALMIVFLGRIKESRKIFLLGTVLGGAFEYLCSLMQEKMFGSISWDYSNNFLNIDGRTTIPFAIIWGLLSLIMMKVVLPYLSKLIEKIPNKIGYPLTWVIIVFMIYNMSLSSLAANRNLERYKGVPANSHIDRFLDKYYPSDRMKEVYGNSEFTK
ncbi:MAG: putative ABC transporter permease [Clostridia bacterium]|nr:putative ABC transporter permease [Clostridia bacterium]